MSYILCYICKAVPAAGNSAYCAGCQPVDIRQQPRGSQCQCAACTRIFASLTDFDRHQERHPRGHLLEGVFTGRCFDPATLGLALAGGVWGTPEGNARRALLAGQMAAVRSRSTTKSRPGTAVLA
jgi:hypothetical protein